MNWARNNRFLATFLGIVIVIGAVASYLLYSRYSHYADVSTQYDSQVTELKRLQGLTTYPNESNLTKYQEVAKNYQEKVADLQSKMAALDTPPANPPLTPLQFQDRLRRVVEETTQHAQTAGVTLPDGVYLGLEQYRGAPPEAAATPVLSTQLTEIQNLVDLILQQHVEKITAMKRGLLAQEVGTSSTAAPAPAIKPGTPAPAAPLVSKYPLEIAFTSLPNAFRETLNKITSAKDFYIIRTLTVKNQMEKGPSRTPDAAAGAPGGFNPNPAGAPGAPAAGGVDASGVPIPPLPDKGPPPLRYVVGQERVDVTARIELASVKPPR